MSDKLSNYLDVLRQIIKLNDDGKTSQNIELINDGKLSSRAYALLCGAQIKSIDTLVLVKILEHLPIVFKKCEFACEFSINNQGLQSLKIGHLEFDECVFKDEFCLIGCTFCGTCVFEACVFEEKTEFINTDFLGYTSFFRSAFLKMANFVNVNFTFVPNFCACVLEREYKKIVTFSNIGIAKNNFYELKKNLDAGFKIALRRKSKIVAQDLSTKSEQSTQTSKKDELNIIANIIESKSTKNYERPLDVIEDYQIEIYNEIEELKKQGYQGYDKITALGLEYVYNAIGADYTLSAISRATLPFYIAVMLLCIFSLSRTGRRNSIVPEG